MYLTRRNPPGTSGTIIRKMYMIELDKLLDYDCVEEIVLLFVQIIVYIISCCRIQKKKEKRKKKKKELNFCIREASIVPYLFIYPYKYMYYIEV
jgi:hypothetical protein